MKIKATNIVFDLDDTLYLEKNYVQSGFSCVGKWVDSIFGITDFYSKAYSLFIHSPKLNIFDLLLKEYGIFSKKNLTSCIDIYRSHIPQITLEADAKESLFILKKQSRKIFLITDGRSLAQWNKIQALGIAALFDKIIVTGDFGAAFYKPHPRAYLEIQQTYNPETFIYIADNPKKDFITPEQLGWYPSVRIKRPFSLHSEQLTPRHILEITQLSDLIF